MSAVREAPAGVGLPAAAPESPYRGIEPFRVVDRAIFFGREREVRRLFRMVTIYRGVLLYGDSGSGKSSLTDAGLIPLAVREGLAPERLRVQPRFGEEVVLERIPVGAGEGPPYLPSLLAPGEDSPRVVLSAPELLARLKRLAEVDDGGARPRPLLIFDQFEEFVTLFEEAPPREANPARESLLELLAELLRSETLPVKLLFVFREDYLAKLNLLFRRAPDLPDHFLRIAPLPPSALPEIIRGPFTHAEGLFPRELPPSLAAKLTAALEARSEQGMLNLTEVQIACLQLWEAEDPEALFDRVGVEGLLSRYLEDALGSLPAPLRDAAVVVLTRLVTGAGTRNVVSKEDLAQALAPGDPPQEVLARAVDALEKTALVRREPRHDVYFYEIASEFLVPWIYRKRNERRVHAERRALREAEARKRRWAYAAAAVVACVALLVAAANYWTNSSEAQVRRANERWKAEAAERRAAERARDALRETLGREQAAALALRQAVDEQNRQAAERDRQAAERELMRMRQTFQRVARDLDTAVQHGAARRAEVSFLSQLAEQQRAALAELQHERDRIDAEHAAAVEARDRVDRERVEAEAARNRLQRELVSVQRELVGVRRELAGMRTKLKRTEVALDDTTRALARVRAERDEWRSRARLRLHGDTLGFH